MIKLYHNPLSPNSRRVWIALLEKGIPFELVEMRLDGDQFAPDFLAISPFHHVPAIADGDYGLAESQAILDYLEAQYPEPALLPRDPKALGRVQMIRMATVNELAPAMRPLVMGWMGVGSPDEGALAQAKTQTLGVLKVFEAVLGEGPFFGGEQLSLADITAGVSIPWMAKLGVDVAQVPRLQAWGDRLESRPSWQQTQATPDLWEAMKSRMQARMKG